VAALDGGRKGARVDGGAAVLKKDGERSEEPKDGGLQDVASLGSPLPDMGRSVDV
jgi:hypothetical protein